MKKRSKSLFLKAQANICQSLEEFDAKALFVADNWERTDQSGDYGGGGKTCILKEGRVFEQAGVNFSEVFGSLPSEMAQKLVNQNNPVSFHATGISLVIHPYSPMIPTTHANYRYLEVADSAWFGGGADLTPYYLFEEDAKHFHSIHKAACDKHELSYYPKFKKQCDEYFYLPHRKETRGIGGLFFDYLGKDKPDKIEGIFSLVSELANCFLSAYLPIAERRSLEVWTEQQKKFQLLRRGRYVEFNLLYDRGTQFGLKTGGRTESILMSLPPEVNWTYNFEPEAGSREALLIDALKTPKDWL